MIRAGIAVGLLLTAAPVGAKDSLGIFGSWGAFRDGDGKRCYAIAKPQSASGHDFTPCASIGTWPERQVRGQVHIRLSRKLAPAPRLRLTMNGRSFELTGGDGDAWATDPSSDAAIVAAMRSASRMSVSGTAANGRRFSETYQLDGAATAMDAATVGCARR